MYRTIAAAIRHSADAGGPGAARAPTGRSSASSTARSAGRGRSAGPRRRPAAWANVRWARTCSSARLVLAQRELDQVAADRQHERGEQQQQRERVQGRAQRGRADRLRGSRRSTTRACAAARTGRRARRPASGAKKRPPETIWIITASPSARAVASTAAATIAGRIARSVTASTARSGIQAERDRALAPGDGHGGQRLARERDHDRGDHHREDHHRDHAGRRRSARRRSARRPSRAR